MMFKQEKNKQEKYKSFTIQVNPTNLKSTIILKNIAEMDYLETYKLNGVYQIFDNFHMLNRPEISNRQRCSLKCMLSQDDADHPYFVRKFIELAYHYYSEHDNQISQFDQLMQTIRKSELLFQYTKQTFFYKLLNKVLRGGNDPLELYYSQYFVKGLHESIRDIYTKQKKKSFICYRGAYLKQQEIESLKQNVGGHIETYGFLSTSLKKQIAISFCYNALIEIQVTDQQRSETLDFGYVYMSQNLSTRTEQHQVLFNVLSSFQVLEVTDATHNFPYRTIKLKYGASYQILYKYKNNSYLQPQQKNLLPLLLTQQQQMQNNYKNYGQILSLIEYCPELIKQTKYYIQKQDQYLDSIYHLLYEHQLKNRLLLRQCKGLFFCMLHWMEDGGKDPSWLTVVQEKVEKIRDCQSQFDVKALFVNQAYIFVRLVAEINQSTGEFNTNYFQLLCKLWERQNEKVKKYLHTYQIQKQTEAKKIFYQEPQLHLDLMKIVASSKGCQMSEEFEQSSLINIEKTIYKIYSPYHLHYRLYLLTKLYSKIVSTNSIDLPTYTSWKDLHLQAQQSSLSKERSIKIVDKCIIEQKQKYQNKNIQKLQEAGQALQTQIQLNEESSNDLTNLLLRLFIRHCFKWQFRWLLQLVFEVKL